MGPKIRLFRLHRNSLADASSPVYTEPVVETGIGPVSEPYTNEEHESPPPEPKEGFGKNSTTHLQCVKTCFQTNRQTEPKGSLFHERQPWPLPAREQRQAVFIYALAGVSGAARLSLPFF